MRQSSTSSFYTHIVISGSNMHVAGVQSASSILKFHPVSRHTRSDIDIKRKELPFVRTGVLPHLLNKDSTRPEPRTCSKHCKYVTFRRPFILGFHILFCQGNVGKGSIELLTDITSASRTPRSISEPPQCVIILKFRPV